MAQRGLKGKQLREVSSPKKMYETVRDYMTKITSDAGAGGGATEAMTVTGLREGDEIMSVTQRVAGANSLAMLGWSTQADDSLTVAWAADPGAGAIVEVVVRRLK